MNTHVTFDSPYCVAITLHRGGGVQDANFGILVTEVKG